MKRIFLICTVNLVALNALHSQIVDQLSRGEIHGNFQTDFQYYNKDSLIGAPIVPEKMLMNGFANLIYTNGPFNAGIRYESYLNALQGFDPNYRGNGIPFRYANYNNNGLDVTIGNFYEQFGSGLIFRSYEERGLGVDNAMDGFRLKYNPYNGIYIKGLIGKQRLFFSEGPGIVRGVDGEIMLNELRETWQDKKFKLIVGVSFVSKYQKDEDPTYILPENVGAWASRASMSYGKFSLTGEYAYKINDPSFMNGYIYKPGDAQFISASFTQKGLGITLSAKRIDNMDFRSDRNETGNNLMINYLPALTRQHTYNLAATLYPYASQTVGEIGYQADIVYTIKKGTLLGGKYGTTININYSNFYALDTVNLNDMATTRHKYKASYYSFGKPVYFSDFNIELNKKFSNKFKMNVMYMNLVYNMDVVLGLAGKGTVYADIAVIDLSYKLNTKHTIRTELQSLTTKQDQGNWATGLIEYTYSPHWFIAIMDQYNYGNQIPDLRIHYITGTIGYTWKANRIMATYGRQRAGIFCVGGVCRFVPASNGLTVTITSSF